MRQPYLVVKHKETGNLELAVVGWAGLGWLALIVLPFFVLGLVL